MIVLFDKSFAKCIDKINDTALKLKVEKVIIEIENANSINELKNSKKLVGFKSYYRIRIGDYRLGFEQTGANTVTLLIICHRKEIYKQFP